MSGRTIQGALSSANTEQVQDIVGGMFQNAAGITWTYNDAAGTITPATDHGGIGGLADDDHTQYALLAGRAGGQTLTGGTAASDGLTLNTTSNATKGVFAVDTNHIYKDASGNVGFGGTPTSRLHLFAGAVAGAGIQIDGTSSPKLRVSDTGASVHNTVQVDGAAAYAGSASNHPYILRVNDVEKVRLTTSDTVVFTPTAGSSILKVQNTGTEVALQARNSADSADDLLLLNPAGGPVVVGHNDYYNTFSVLGDGITVWKSDAVADGNCAYLDFYSHRGTFASRTANAADDDLLLINAYGYNGGEDLAATILFEADGTPAGGFVQGRVSVKTTNASGVNTQAWRSDSAQNTIFGPGAADRRLHAEADSATTNAVTYVGRFTSTSSGTPANGIGVGLEFEVETASGNNEIGATIEAVAVDTTSTSEDFDLVGKVMVAGAAATTRIRIGGVHSSLGGDHYAALSPQPSASYPQIFLTPNTVILESPPDYNTYLLCNSYFDGTNFRALAAGEGVELVAGLTGYRWQTAASVSAGAAQTFISRDGQPTAGRQWSNVSGSRAFDTVYQNTTGYEIEVAITISHSATSSVDIKVDTSSPPAGIVGRSSPLTLNAITQLTATIPNLGYYELDTIAAGASLVNWMEMR